MVYSIKCNNCMKLCIAVILVIITLCSSGSYAKPSFCQASFVPPASPSTAIIQSIPPVVPWSTGKLKLETDDDIGSTSTVLFAKKKTAPAAAKKIQVKMLKHVAGTGHVGDVVMVTPAFFNNKLRPTSAAVVISDEEVAQEKAEAAAAERETIAHATELKEKLDNLTLTIRRKAGPDGQLFGGVGAKVIMEELGNTLKDDYLNQKWVKITSLTDGDGKKMRGDIKHTGDFGVSISLTKNISAKFAVVVADEN